MARQVDPALLAYRDFLQRFLHDLATPLSAVSLHLEGADRRVRRGADPSEALAVAREELAKTLELFELGRELLLAEPEEPETLSFDEIVSAVVRESGARSVRVQGETGGRLVAGRRALSSALSALLANAFQSSGVGGVTVIRERAGGKLQVRIESPGRLSVDDPEKLFSFRAASSGKNWGLGLAGARLRVAQAGGAVRVEQRGDRIAATIALPEETS